MKTFSNNAQRALSCVALGAALFTAAACNPPATGAGAHAAGAQSRPPDFELDTVNGKSIRLSQYLGKDVVLIDFWATYCDPCLASMPHLNTLYKKYKSQGFVVLGISIDGPDSVAQVKTEVAKLGITFPILLDQQSQVVALYNPATTAPFSVLIGRDGRIISEKAGYTSSDAADLDREVAAAVAKK